MLSAATNVIRECSLRNPPLVPPFPFVPQPTFSIAFSSELASIQFNFAGGNGLYENHDNVTVQAYNNGVLVGSETTYGTVPSQDGFVGGYYAELEGVGGFIGAPFNEVVITGETGYYGYGPSLLVDNIDVSAAAPEPLGLTAFGLLLVGTGVVYRRRRSWFKHCALAFAFISAGLFSSTAKASDITTISFEYSGEGDPLAKGVLVTGEGSISFPAGLTDVTTAEVTSFSYSEYYDLSNCQAEGCFNIVSFDPLVYYPIPNFLETFTLSSFIANSYGSEIIATAPATPFNLETSDIATLSFNPEGSGGGTSFGALLIFGGANFVDVTTSPEPASIGLFAAGLVLAGLAARRARH